MLNSRSMSRLFIQSEELMPILFAEKWDAAAGKWKDADPREQPSIDEAVRMFEREIRYVSKNESISSGPSRSWQPRGPIDSLS